MTLCIRVCSNIDNRDSWFEVRDSNGDCPDHSCQWEWLHFLFLKAFMP